jgi:hypothetical protein
MFPDIQKAVGGSSTSGTLFPPVPHRAEIVGDTSWGPVYRASMPWFSYTMGTYPPPMPMEAGSVGDIPSVRTCACS